MIIDHINNAEFYYGLGARIESGLRFLKTADLEHLPPGRNDIKGKELFAMVSEYETKAPAADSLWEAHRRYLDIQYVVSGLEAIGYQYIANMEITKPYDETGDALFLRGSGSRLVIGEGCFAIFWPQDAHQPCLSAHGPQAVRKIVVKVLAN
jgi:YhcH/YjgK/YiaL family protein